MTTIASLVLNAKSIVDSKHLSDSLITIITEVEIKSNKRPVALFINQDTLDFIASKLVTYVEEQTSLQTIFGLEIITSNFLPFGKVVALTSDELKSYKEAVFYLNQLQKEELDGKVS